MGCSLAARQRTTSRQTRPRRRALCLATQSRFRMRRRRASHSLRLVIRRSMTNAASITAVQAATTLQSPPRLRRQSMPLPARLHLAFRRCRSRRPQTQAIRPSRLAPISVASRSAARSASMASLQSWPASAQSACSSRFSRAIRLVSRSNSSTQRTRPLHSSQCPMRSAWAPSRSITACPALSQRSRYQSSSRSQSSRAARIESAISAAVAATSSTRHALCARQALRRIRARPLAPRSRLRLHRPGHRRRRRRSPRRRRLHLRRLLQRRLP